MSIGNISNVALEDHDALMDNLQHAVVPAQQQMNLRSGWKGRFNGMEKYTLNEFYNLKDPYFMGNKPIWSRIMEQPLVDSFNIPIELCYEIYQDVSKMDVCYAVVRCVELLVYRKFNEIRRYYPVWLEGLINQEVLRQNTIQPLFIGSAFNAVQRTGLLPMDWMVGNNQAGLIKSSIAEGQWTVKDGSIVWSNLPYTQWDKLFRDTLHVRNPNHQYCLDVIDMSLPEQLIDSNGNPVIRKDGQGNVIKVDDTSYNGRQNEYLIECLKRGWVLIWGADRHYSIDEDGKMIKRGFSSNAHVFYGIDEGTDSAGGDDIIHMFTTDGQIPHTVQLGSFIDNVLSDKNINDVLYLVNLL